MQSKSDAESRWTTLLASNMPKQVKRERSCALLAIRWRAPRSRTVRNNALSEWEMAQLVGFPPPRKTQVRQRGDTGALRTRAGGKGGVRLLGSRSRGGLGGLQAFFCGFGVGRRVEVAQRGGQSFVFLGVSAPSAAQLALRQPGEVGGEAKFVEDLFEPTLRLQPKPLQNRRKRLGNRSSLVLAKHTTDAVE